MILMHVYFNQQLDIKQFTTIMEASVLKEMELKRKLIEAKEAVRRKFNSLKSNEVEDKLVLEKVYEPITTPLKRMSESVVKNSTSTITKRRRKEVPVRSDISKRPGSEEEEDMKDDDDEATDTAAGEWSFARAAAAAADGKEKEAGDATMASTMETPPPSSPSFLSSPSSSNVTFDPSVLGAASTPMSMTTTTPSLALQHLAEAHVKNLLSAKGRGKYDTRYGIRISPHDSRTTLMGNAVIKFIGDKITVWRENQRSASYKGSKDLYDLIFLKRPITALEGTISGEDERTYQDLLCQTNAPYKDYDPQNELYASTLYKFTKIIKPLMVMKGAQCGAEKPRRRSERHTVVTSTSTPSSGQGFGAMKVYLDDNKQVQYVHWNQAKELIDRLRLLWISKMAGHSGLDNEIISILEELKEEGIVHF